MILSIAVSVVITVMEEIMDRTLDEVLSVAKEMNLTVSVLSSDEIEKKIEMIYEKYIIKNLKTTFLWEDMADAEFINDSDGWSYIDSFVGKNHCLLMFEEFKKWFIVEVHSGKDLKILLEETSSFEFYVFDEILSYLICFSHHDQLIGCGKAKTWIKTLKK